jgi:hypothetical protein
VSRKAWIGLLSTAVTAVAIVVAALIGRSQLHRIEQTSLSGEALHEGKPEAETRFPLAIGSEFSPSGWMGDGEHGTEYLSLSTGDAIIDGAVHTAMYFEYTRGPQGWAGVYWQYPDGNWGSQEGKDLTGAREITFWARGAVGGEVVEFKAGGIQGRFSDSFEKSLGQMALSPTWQQYHIDLTGLDLSCVIGAFAWSAPAPEAGTLRFSLAALMVR